MFRNPIIILLTTQLFMSSTTATTATDVLIAPPVAPTYEIVASVDAPIAPVGMTDMFTILDPDAPANTVDILDPLDCTDLTSPEDIASGLAAQATAPDPALDQTLAQVPDPAEITDTLIQHLAEDLIAAAFEAEAEEAAAAAREAHIARLKDDHKNAGTIYKYLSNLGWSDPVIAGVIGNAMTECGGQTLTLQPYIYGEDGNYYGVFMWSLRYNPTIVGRTLISQLDYLLETIAGNIEYFGGDFEHFLTLTDPDEAARYFNKYYERGENSDRRARNAATAYAWIINT